MLNERKDKEHKLKIYSHTCREHYVAMTTLPVSRISSSNNKMADDITCFKDIFREELQNAKLYLNITKMRMYLSLLV